MNLKNMNRILVFLFVGLPFSNQAKAFYNPQTGRWLSRDPVAEQGGKNLFGFTGNDPIDTYDINGMFAAAPGCVIRVAVGIASVPADGVILGTAVSAGTVYVTYQVCKAVYCQVFCGDRHPTWPLCGGASDPQSAITGAASGLYPGWNIDGLPTISGSGPADPAVCPSGGTWYTVTTRFFTVIQTGTITYTVNLAVACCNCCNRFTAGTNCRVIHPGRGSGQQPPPPSGPPFHGQK
jgi:hypothetical protein